MPVTVKGTVSWDVELYSLVDKYECFGGICCLNLQGRGTDSCTLHGVTFQKAVILCHVFKKYNSISLKSNPCHKFTALISISQISGDL
jgi:hypothetical protein